MRLVDPSIIVVLPFLFMLLLWCLMGIVMLLGTMFWIWAIIDCMTKEPAQGNDKLIWLLIIIFTHFVGSLIYFFVRRPERRKMFGR